MMRHNQSGSDTLLPLCLSRNRSQRLAMEMIEVGMRYQHQIHRRKIAYIHSRQTQAFENEEPARKIRIDGDIQAADLQKEARVSNKRHPQFTACGELWLVRLSSARSNCGVAYQARELSGSLSQRGILQ